MIEYVLHNQGTEMKAAPIASVTDIANRHGTLSVRTRITVRDIFGRERFPSLSLGRVHNVDIEQAAAMTKGARMDNVDLHQIEATFTVHL